MPIDPMEQLRSTKAHAFLSGQGCDARGRTLEEVLAFSNEQLESIHDYIQWLFPLVEPSRFNPEAPLLDREAIKAIRSDPVATDGQERALARMLTFYEDTAHWASEYDHNLMRITRILGSCRILLKAGVSQGILNRIQRRCEALGFEPGEETLGYWERAARQS